jgi:environmental stress-induced protein Ves
MIRLDAAAGPPRPWRNGGGLTRELFTDAPGEGWRVRLSLADITRDGPFSAFPGTTRWFSVVEGAGVWLGDGGGAIALAPGDPPWRFDGALAPACRLRGGPTRDLNLMLRGADGALEPVRADVPWARRARWRGVFTARALRCRVGGQGHDLAPMQGLLQVDGDDAPWCLEPPAGEAARPLAWWWWAHPLDEVGGDGAPHRADRPLPPAPPATGAVILPPPEPA